MGCSDLPSVVFTPGWKLRGINLERTITVGIAKFIITVGAVLVVLVGVVLTHVQCLNVWDWSENNDDCDMLNDQNYELMSADLPPTPPSPLRQLEYTYKHV